MSGLNRDPADVITDSDLYSDRGDVAAAILRDLIAAGFVLFHPDDFPPDATLGFDRTTGEVVALEPVGRGETGPLGPQWWRFPAAVSAQEEPDG